MHRKINVKQGSSNPIFLSRHRWRGSLQKIKLLVNEEFHLDLDRIKTFRQNKLTHAFVLYKKPNSSHKQSPSLLYCPCCLERWSLPSMLVCRVNLLWGSRFLSCRLHPFMVSLTLFHYSSSSERGRIPALSFHQSLRCTLPCTEPTVLPATAPKMPNVPLQGKHTVISLCDATFWHSAIFAV